AAEELQLLRVSVDQRTGRFGIVFDLPGSDAARHISLRFTGTAIDTLETVVLVRPLNRGEIIKKSDIAIETRPKAQVADEFINSETAVGLAAKRPLRPGVALRPNDLMKPEAVQRNEAVTITYEIPGVILTARGKALEAGSVGEIIGV